MQPQHITEWAYQLHIQIVVEVLDFITAAFQFFQSISRHTDNVGQLIHGFFGLV